MCVTAANLGSPRCWFRISFSKLRDHGDSKRDVQLFSLEPLCVDRYTSHVIFLMHLAHNHTVHITLLGSRRATQCVCVARIHSIFMPPTMCLMVCWLRPRSVLLPFLSVAYLFASTLYLHAQHFISNVNSVEGNHCAFAQYGVLHHGDFPSSHRL